MALEKEFESAPSVLAFFGSELRRLRGASGLSQERLGEIINFTGSMVGMVETARRSPTRDFAERCDAALGTDGTLTRLWPLVSRGSHPAWFREYVELEATARKIHKFEALHVPGLLQTRDYAKALLRAGDPGESAEAVETLVAARMERQTVLTGPTPPLLWVVMDEGVIRRAVGGRAVMRAQLAHLLAISETPNVILQIAPFELGERVSLDSSMTVLTLPDGPSVVYAEGLRAGRIISRQDEVERWGLSYDLLRADALSPKASLHMIEAAMKGPDS